MGHEYTNTEPIIRVFALRQHSWMAGASYPRMGHEYTNAEPTIRVFALRQHSWMAGADPIRVFVWPQAFVDGRRERLERNKSPLPVVI